ncbi:MAG: hypothetical protein PF489_06220 [Salinivirgaceae bacterium]|nr:hypothetical protein [Salinivirgaceae bacterium]
MKRNRYMLLKSTASFQRNASLLHVTPVNINENDARKLYFSTNLPMDLSDAILYYRKRIQIEPFV